MVMAKTSADKLPLVDVLEKLRTNFKLVKHPLGSLIDELLQRMRGGPGSSRNAIKTVGTELAGLVPEEECLMIQAGEASGRIDEGFNNASEYIASKRKLNTAIISALSKPFFYLVALFGLLLFFSYKLLPSFANVRPRNEWPAEAYALGWLADHVLVIVGIAVALLVLSSILITYLANNWVSSSRDFADRHIPPFSMLAQMKAAAFIGSLAGFISAGIPFTDAISSIRKGGNTYMRYQCDRIESWIRKGKHPTECLTLLPMVHVRYHWIIDIYAMSSDSSYAYKTISREMLDRTVKTISIIFGNIVANLVLALLAACIMWIYFSMFAIADIKR